MYLNYWCYSSHNHINFFVGVKIDHLLYFIFGVCGKGLLTLILYSKYIYEALN